MTVTVDTSEKLNTTLRENDIVKSVTQNIALLLSTKQGTVPMYREFGLPMEFVDKPIDIAETIAALEVSDAIEEFEPRAELKDLYLKKSPEGKISVIVEVSVNEGN